MKKNNKNNIFINFWLTLFRILIYSYLNTYIKYLIIRFKLIPNKYNNNNNNINLILL
jgi:hypothetical protein